MGRVTAPNPVLPVPPADLPGTLGALRAAGHRYRTVKQELRDNLLARMRSGEDRFPGIVGYDDTVLPEVERALLAGHDMVLLGERGQGKTRLIRSLGALLDEWTPVLPGSVLNEHPLHPLTPASRAQVAEAGDDLPIGWLHRSMRYGEKLATPDTSVGDLIGDVDPIRIAQGRTLGDPETIHFGLVPRTNRGIFAVNELPDLAERIQVALLNVLEERDIQVRGYQLRLPLDLLLVASANPEDYTNRGRIITPLKDRFGAEIRTHYPVDLELELALIRQEADLVAEVPEHVLEVLARFARAVRESPSVDPRSGVSARFAIAAAETVAAAALRRAGLLAASGTPDGRPEAAGGPGRRRGVGDQHAARQGRVRERRGGPGDRDPRPPAADRDRRDVPGPAGRAGPVRLHRAGRRGRGDRDRRAGLRRPSCCARSAPCRGWRRCSTGSAWATRPPRRRPPPPSSSCWKGCT